MQVQELRLREQIIEQCLWMNRSGLNQGTSGNISVRYGDQMLITPSGIPYAQLTPAMIARMPLHGQGVWEGPQKPSTEWRFHMGILQDRAELHAVVHTHSTFATTLALTGREIPACHYMIAAFGGPNIRCAPYSRYGTEQLAQDVVLAMRDRSGCILQNHGMVTAGPTLEKAMWFAVELETLAKQYYHSLLIGGPQILSDAQIQETLESFETYGLQMVEVQPDDVA
jgi:L-fuculose-phosphate aldolase